MGQRGRAASPAVRALSWMRRMPATESSSAPAMSWCISAGSSPATKRGSQPQPRRNWVSSSSPMRARMVGLLIL
jgi:hypothetical protein